VDFEQVAYQEANTLTQKQYQDFLTEIEKIPSKRSPISGQTARLCIEFMEDTGCRVSETIHVKKKDCDFKTRILLVTYPKVEQKCKCSRWKNKNQYSNAKVLEHADPKCERCLGKGKWKKPQRTTFTPRIYVKLQEYCNTLQDNDLLFPVSRQSLYNWTVEAGERAQIHIFQQKAERKIEGMFIHFFRELCSKRIKMDSRDDPYRDELVQCKRRDSYDIMADRYTKIDINYLLQWEAKTYGMN
jgi:integrase